MALTTSNTLVAWGNDASGQVSGVPSGSNFMTLSGGFDFGLAMRNDNTLVGWGFNYYNQCNVPSGNLYTLVEAGGYHGLALTPVPEPASAGVLLVAGGLALLRRHRD